MKYYWYYTAHVTLGDETFEYAHVIESYPDNRFPLMKVYQTCMDSIQVPMESIIVSNIVEITKEDYDSFLDTMKGIAAYE